VLRLASYIYPMASVTLMGMLFIAALVSGYDTPIYLISAAVAGAALALPVSYFIARAIKAEE